MTWVVWCGVRGHCSHGRLGLEEFLVAHVTVTGTVGHASPIEVHGDGPRWTVWNGLSPKRGLPWRVLACWCLFGQVTKHVYADC